MNRPALIKAAGSEEKVIFESNDGRFSMSYHQGEQVPQVKQQWFRSLGKYVRRFMNSWRRLADAENKHANHRIALLDFVGPQVHKIYDRKYDAQLTIYPTRPTADLEILRQLPTDIYNKCVVTCVKMDVWVPVTTQRSRQTIVNKLSQYLSRYMQGWLEVFDEEGVYVNEEHLRHLCQQKEIPFPENAFDSTLKVSVRHNPKWPVGGRRLVK